MSTSQQDYLVFWQQRFRTTVDAQQALWAGQGYRCAACRDDLPLAQARPDYDYEAQQLRGFLCSQCNHVITQSLGSVERLLACAAYMQKAVR